MLAEHEHEITSHDCDWALQRCVCVCVGTGSVAREGGASASAKTRSGMKRAQIPGVQSTFSSIGPESVELAEKCPNPGQSRDPDGIGLMWGATWARISAKFGATPAEIGHSWPGMGQLLAPTCGWDPCAGGVVDVCAPS